MSKRDRAKKLPAKWGRRTLHSARLAGSLARAKAREALGREDGGSAAKIAEQMDTLKGLALKLGQMMSYVEGAMPPDAQRVLRRLQHNSKPMDTQVVHAVIEEELGAPVGELFDSLEPEPFAAASIGQVHRAVLDGQSVAVKVQYPDIKAALKVDLGSMKGLGFLGTMGTKVDGVGLVEELRARMLEECDYRLEAQNQQIFARLFQNDATTLVPEVVPSRSSERVLTTAMAQGKPLYDFVETASDEARQRAAHTIWSFGIRSIFGHGVFNGDPHPGNYLFHDDGRVVFLDYGCVRYYETDLVEGWRRMVEAVRADDLAAFREAYTNLGFVAGDPAKYDFVHQLEIMRYLQRPTLEEHFHFTSEYVRESYSLIFSINPNTRRTRLPPEWLLANRVQWGVNSVMALLDAKGNFRDVFWEAIEGPTTLVRRDEAVTAATTRPPNG